MRLALLNSTEKSEMVEMAKFAEFMQMFAVVKFKARYL